MKILALVALFCLSTATAWSAPSKIYAQAKQLVDTQDYLGFRIYIRNTYAKRITVGEWFALKNLIYSAADHAGYDLVPFWNARNSKGKSEIDDELFRVDQLLKQNKFQEAFTLAQREAVKMKELQKTRRDASMQLPYIYHLMGRALYGAGRYEDAFKVYQWIGVKYPLFVQVLFEKMWAAFKAGRVDLALGAIASQRSTYFSKYLPPESYLIQSYLYRRLCRDDDQKQVLDEMNRYETILENPKSDLPLVHDVNTLVLWQLSNLPKKSTDNLKLISLSLRDQEQAEIKMRLKKASEAARAKTLKDLKSVIAYQQLGGQSDSKLVLQPIEHMKSRDALLKQNLEVWPADSSEEWMDEIGKHVLIGESLCKQQP
jgi:tetratricopeptide (TPR) repeat protein